MIQPLAKLRFVERYCNPTDGWRVFVDIDPSEEGRTGSQRQKSEARARQQRMIAEAPVAVEALKQLGACVGDRRAGWRSCFGTTLPRPQGDRDVIAVHLERRILWVAEVEGDSGGQPEVKIYKALGQLVCAASEMELPDFDRWLTLVASGEREATHLARARASVALGISGLALAELPEKDVWLFRAEVAPRQKLTGLQGQYLAFIGAYTKVNGIAPAEADMQGYFRVAPPSVHQMVLTLERKGLIARLPGKARSIRVLVPRVELPALE